MLLGEVEPLSALAPPFLAKISEEARCHEPSAAHDLGKSVGESFEMARRLERRSDC